MTPTTRPVGMTSAGFLLVNSSTSFFSSSAFFLSLSATPPAPSSSSASSSFRATSHQLAHVLRKHLNIRSWSMTSSPGAFHSDLGKISTTTMSPSTDLFMFSLPTKRTALSSPATLTRPFAVSVLLSGISHLQVIVLTGVEMSLVESTTLDARDQSILREILQFSGRFGPSVVVLPRRRCGVRDARWNPPHRLRPRQDRLRPP